VTAATDVSGNATSPPVTANGVAGAYQVKATLTAVAAEDSGTEANPNPSTVFALTNTAAATPAPTAPTRGPVPSATALPRTGSSSGPLAAAGIALCGIGGTLLLVARKSRRANQATD
jgi:LPXTG-motif cell wall-anchored protein